MKWIDIEPGLYQAQLTDDERRQRYEVTDAFVEQARKYSPAPRLLDEVVRIYKRDAGK